MGQSPLSLPLVVSLLIGGAACAGAGDGDVDDDAPIVVDAVSGLDHLPASGPGPWRVNTHDLGDGHHLYLPSTLVSQPEPSLFPLPFVVFSPGFSASPGDYTQTVEHIASHGFAVVAADHGFSILSALGCMTQRDGLQRVTAAANLVRLRARTPGDDLFGVVSDRQGLATVGHSYGGKVSLWLAREHDVRVDAVVALDPVDGGADNRPGYCSDATVDDGFPRLSERLPGNTMPSVLVFTAGLSGDCAPREGNGAVLAAAIEDDVIQLTLPRATHTDFLDDVADGDCAACGVCPASEERGADVLRLVRGATVSFLRHRFLGDDRDARWLLDNDVMGDDVQQAVDVVRPR
jgi:pimeloyl-ACP methyl ester carboxylesterase